MWSTMTGEVAQPANMWGPDTLIQESLSCRDSVVSMTLGFMHHFVLDARQSHGDSLTQMRAITRAETHRHVAPFKVFELRIMSPKEDSQVSG